MGDRRAQLQDLVAHLSALIDVLAFDTQCQWRRHFTSCLSTATSLSSGSPSQQQLNELSGSVMSVFGGMGSFGDYAPVREVPGGTFSVIPGMETLPDLSGRVYGSALALRTVES